MSFQGAPVCLRLATRHSCSNGQRRPQEVSPFPLLIPCSLIEEHQTELSTSESLRLSSVALPESSQTVSTAEIILLAVCGILILTACITSLYVFSYCKKYSCLPSRTTCRRRRESVEKEYMVDATTAGPRPYDVHQVTRKTAQEILSARPLPDPFSDDGRSSTDSHNRSQTCGDFANSLR